MTGQSLSLPMTIPTTGRSVVSLIVVRSSELVGGSAGPQPQVVEVLAADRDVAELAAGSDLLAVEMDAQRRVAVRGSGRPRGTGRSVEPPSTLAITVHRRPGARCRRGAGPARRRRCCSNWLVTAPSMVQWPLLCGRMASSFDEERRRPCSSSTSNSSTASTPVTPSSLGDAHAIVGRGAGDVGVHAAVRGRAPRCRCRPPARSRRAARLPSRPLGLRATSAASSRSRSRPPPRAGRRRPAGPGSPTAASQSSMSPGPSMRRTPLPS